PGPVTGLVLGVATTPQLPSNPEDFPDLSIADGPPPVKAPPALPEAGGGSGGGAATPPASHLAGRALPTGPRAPASGANHEEGAALSLRDAPRGGRVSPAVSPSLAGSTPRAAMRAPGTARRPSEKFVTPPPRPVAPQPAVSVRSSPVAPAT